MPLDAQEDVPEEALLLRYAAGDRAAARALTVRLTPVVFAQAFRMLGDQAEAEDVAQEALLRLWRQAPDWRAGEAKVTTWLYRVTANLCTDILRKRGRVEAAGDALPEQADPAARADLQLQDRARIAALRQALGDLPERQRDAMVLRHLEGHGNEAIAAHLSASVEAVESLLARGKRGLVAALQGRKDALGYGDD